MKSAFAPAALLWALQAVAQSSSQTTTRPGSLTLSGSAIASSLLVPTGLYQDDSSTTTYSSTSTYGKLTGAANETYILNSTSTGASTTSTATNTLLVGSVSSSTQTGNSTATATSLSATATNTTPCNGYPEFCNKLYSNVSMVVAHNSPFDIAHNAASNQQYGVLVQLNDGIRGLQFETHKPNNTMRLCHTSCDLLDAGTLEDYLATVATWLQANPYEVITIMMGNDDRVNPNNYTAPFQNSGMLKYVYTPPQNPMPLDAWPTMAEMIITNKRVVVMLDYLANQTAIPWLLDQFSQQWQTPFSPTDINFPCIVQRPPNQAIETSRNRMYMANHNLNVEISISTIDLLVPAYGELQNINSADNSTNGSLELSLQTCLQIWNRPPNFLLVDYYNIGNFNGSVFQVAANANNVLYDRSSCCDISSTATSGSSRVVGSANKDVWIGISIGVGVLLSLA